MGAMTATGNKSDGGRLKLRAEIFRRDPETALERGREIGGAGMSTDPLRFEKAMMGDWFRERFGTPRR
jgi:hypothetical protein